MLRAVIKIESRLQGCAYDAPAKLEDIRGNFGQTLLVIVPDKTEKDQGNGNESFVQEPGSCCKQALEAM